MVLPGPLEGPTPHPAPGAYTPAPPPTPRVFRGGVGGALRHGDLRVPAAGSSPRGTGRGPGSEERIPDSSCPTIEVMERLVPSG